MLKKKELPPQRTSSVTFLFFFSFCVWMSLFFGVFPAVAEEKIGPPEVDLQKYLSTQVISTILAPEYATKVATLRATNRIGVPLISYGRGILPNAVLSRYKTARILPRTDPYFFTYLYWQAATWDGADPEGVDFPEQVDRNHLRSLLRLKKDTTQGFAFIGNDLNGKACLVLPPDHSVTVLSYLKRMTGLGFHEARFFSEEDDAALQSILLRQQLAHCLTSMQTAKMLQKISVHEEGIYRDTLADQIAFYHTILDGTEDKRALEIFYGARLLAELEYRPNKEGQMSLQPSLTALSSMAMLRVIAEKKVTDQEALIRGTRQLYSALLKTAKLVSAYEALHPENKKRPKVLRLANAFQWIVNSHQDFPAFSVGYAAQYLSVFDGLAPSYAEQIAEPRLQSYIELLPKEYRLLRSYAYGWDDMTMIPDWPKEAKPYQDPFIWQEKLYQKFQ